MNISILKSLYLLNKVKDIQRLNVLNFIINITKGLYLKLELTCTIVIPGKKLNIQRLNL